ncbi:MAG: tetratricopeptide repeat protein [Rhodobacteraceae bacterium]|nr:tetratricopeptide repeat protein [Paracoccaceae bacterium]
MSDTDTFINEVNEEVRRDKLFKLMKRYGWIAVVLILGIVGGAAYTEYSKAQTRGAAQTLGDEILAALAQNDSAARAKTLAAISAQTPGGDAILKFLTATAQAEAGDTDQAIASLSAVSKNGDVPEIYRQIASFKALTLQAKTMPVAQRRLQFEALASPGARLRLLAEEQLALIDISEGQVDAALTRLQAILQDAEVDTGLQQRVAQVIVALGAEPGVRSGI